MLSQEPQKQTICVQSDRGFQGFWRLLAGGSSVSPDGEAGVLLDGGAASLYGPRCCRPVLNRKSIPIFPPHCPGISFSRCVCSPLICFPGLMLPFCSLPLTEGYNFVRRFPSSPPKHRLLGDPGADRVPRCCGWAAPGGWLAAEAFQHAGCGGLESWPSPAMPLLSRVPPPVWPLVDGGLTSWGPLISGRRSLRGSEAGEQACAAAWMAWGHRLPSEGAMPSHSRSCSDGAMGTLPLSAGGSPAGPPPQTLREDVAGCAWPSGGETAVTRGGQGGPLGPSFETTRNMHAGTAKALGPPSPSSTF